MLDAYTPGTGVWIQSPTTTNNPDQTWISAKVVSSNEQSGELRIVDERGKDSTIQLRRNDRDRASGKEVAVADLPPLKNPPEFETPSDLSLLHYLNEPSGTFLPSPPSSSPTQLTPTPIQYVVLHAIKARYAQRKIYTYSGLALLAINSFAHLDIYSPSFVQLYSSSSSSPSSPSSSSPPSSNHPNSALEPHVFALAESARLNMLESGGKGQTIIVSGDSGAGKTESAKLIMRFLASSERARGRAGVGERSRSRAQANVGVGVGGDDVEGDEAGQVEQRMLATNPILEAFGNAKTVHNDNSSRFGKYLQILFDARSRIVGAQIRTYLLERSRLVFQSQSSTSASSQSQSSSAASAAAVSASSDVERERKADVADRERRASDGERERNFHIFYQLFAGLSASERTELGLGGKPGDFSYLSSSASASSASVLDSKSSSSTSDPRSPGARAKEDPDLPDAQQFEQTRQALLTVNIPPSTQTELFRLLSSILHLGNIPITSQRSGAASISPTDPSLILSSSLLGIPPSSLLKWTISKQISARSEKITMSLNPAQASSVRDSIAKYIYAKLFDWLVGRINESLDGEEGDDYGLGRMEAESFVGILDIYGFEYYTDSSTGGGGGGGGTGGGMKNSFEQFCINYANERLQHEFNSHVFKLEQDEYVREGISWSFISFPDNQLCIDAIESRLGILSLLDEESKLASGSDASFQRKVVNTWSTPSQHNKNAHDKAVVKSSRFGSSGFVVSHYAANVTYETAGFLEKNRDTLPDEHLDMLDTTTNGLLRQILSHSSSRLPLHASNPGAAPPTPGRPFSPAAGSESDFGASSPTAPVFETSSKVLQVHSTLNASTTSRPPTPNSGTTDMARTESSSGATTRKQTLGGVFKSSLSSLMDTIAMTNPHYVRCIKPNRHKRAWEFDESHVMGQLRACGILETVRISCAGYPSRWGYDDFAGRYAMLVKRLPAPRGTDHRSISELILHDLIPDTSKYQFGHTKIFLRAGSLAEMDAARSSMIERTLVLVRRYMARYRAVKYLRNARAAAVRIQRWWRKELAWKEIRRLRGEVKAASALVARRRVDALNSSRGPSSFSRPTPASSPASSPSKSNRLRPPRARPPPLNRSVIGSKRYHPRTSSTLKDTLEEHFLVWPSDSFPDLIGSTMGPRQAIDVPRDSISIQARAWPTTNGSYSAKFRGVWNLRAMALKQLKSVSEPEDVVARFHKEIQAWSRLKHSNISPFIGVFVDATRSVFLVEPWSLNGDINHYLKVIRPSADRVALLSQIARGLAYLHEESVIHGDLRGCNIAVNDVGEAVLSDIGINRVALDDSNPAAVTASLIEANAARWMAPELLDPHNDNPRLCRETDMYAFSMVVIELYTGLPPLHKVKDIKIPAEILGGTRPERPPIITAPSIQISESLWQLANKCWVKAPSLRPTALQVKHKLLAERSRR